ncbi:zinc finger protein 184 isoform X5 [Plutella xylostella]|uniref:zinc finger protein 184 isoform X5 n=1 Tax=Plutella xylostella TaxID=51655 RepID=UPI002032D344|nr:zinc finger protein 184 isoform X5 [Plutella xylostella]
MESFLISGICRCCASEGPSKNLINKYKWMGEEEVYSEMLKDCFDVTLHSTDDPATNGGICEVCITQLRNAYNFKKQVIVTEEFFKRRLLDGEHTFTADIKLEVDRGDCSASENDIDAADDLDSEMSVKSEQDEEKPKRRKVTARASTSRAAKKVKAEDAKSAVGKRKKKKQKGQESATPERIEHRVNLTTILQHSNASPFRDKTMRGFSCLYCAKSFPYIEDLRRHTAQQSEKDKLNTMIDYKLSYNPIKVDITDLICNICNSPMKDLNELKDHLTSAHDKFIHKDIKDIILPFRLMDGTNFTCVICSVVHISFKNLYLHMSSHYRNYCCNKCGVGYITIAALRKHMKTHEDGNFPCAYCDKVYSSKAKKRNHEKGVHTGGWLRNKCPHCPEIFVSYYDRSEHLVRVHNLAPVTYPCNACNKVYKKKFELNRHIKHHHLQQKNYMCDFCKLSFFSKRGLVDHMARHTGSDVFCCELCNKRFARLRTLKEHIRSHDNQKKYQCDVCKKTFMQKSSLKIHSKLHQDDLEIFKEFDDVKHLIDNRDLTLKQIAAESKQKAEEEKAAKAIGVL